LFSRPGDAGCSAAKDGIAPNGSIGFGPELVRSMTVVRPGGLHIVDSKTHWREVRNAALWRTAWLAALALAVCPVWHLHIGKLAPLFWIVATVLFAVALLSLIAARDAQTGCAGFSADP
jgi:hypothetical protein